MEHSLADIDTPPGEKMEDYQKNNSALLCTHKLDRGVVKLSGYLRQQKPTWLSNYGDTISPSLSIDLSFTHRGIKYFII